MICQHLLATSHHLPEFVCHWPPYSSCRIDLATPLHTSVFPPRGLWALSVPSTWITLPGVRVPRHLLKVLCPNIMSSARLSLTYPVENGNTQCSLTRSMFFLFNTIGYSILLMFFTISTVYLSP